MATQFATHPARARSLKFLSVLLLVALVGAGCSQPRLERMARELAASIPQQGSGTVAGSIVVRLTGVDLKGGETAAVGLGPIQQLPTLPLAAARFVVQPAMQRAALIGPTDEVVSLSGPRVVYARRKLNGPADKRPWVRLEYERLDDVDVPRLEALLENQDAGALAIISPQFVLDLLRGVLTGSIKHEELRGGGTTLRFNTSIEKADRELKRSKEARKDRERLLRTLAITGDIFKGVAQLSADGKLLNLHLELKETPNRRTKVGIDVDLDMTAGPTQAVSLTAPKRDTTIRVSSLAALRGSIADFLAPEKVAGLPTTLPTTLPEGVPADLLNVPTTVAP